MTTSFRTAGLAPSPPNIIFLLVDDLGYNDLGYTDPSIMSPNIDALAEEGIKFSNHYTASWCAPSRASIMSGRYWPLAGYGYAAGASVAGSVGPNGGLSLQWELMPEMLQSVGYATLGFGKWHLGSYSAEYLPENRGFDSYWGYFSQSTNYVTHANEDPDCDASVAEFWADGAPVREGHFFHDRETMGEEPNEAVFSTKIWTDAAVRAILDIPMEQPLFLYMAYQDVHPGSTLNGVQGGLIVPRPYFEMYDDPNCPYTTESATFANVRECSTGRTSNCYCNRLVKRAKVTFLDAHIGRLLDALKNTGRYDNSVIVFSGDNGAPVNDGGSNWPLKGTKASQWEGAVRPPAFLHSPLLQRHNSSWVGKWYDAVIHETDWFPTFATLAGADVLSEVPRQATGVDLWPFLSGQVPADPRDEVLIGLGTLRAGQFKIITENPSTRSGLPGAPSNCLFQLDGGPTAVPLEFGGNPDVCSDLTCATVDDMYDQWLCSEFPCTRESPCLFDLENDPTESINVAAFHPDTVEALLGRLQFWRDQYYYPLGPVVSNPSLFCDAAAAAGGFAVPWLVDICPAGGLVQCYEHCPLGIAWRDSCMDECALLCPER
jgi:arylsulfatase A-like enzyme